MKSPVMSNNAFVKAEQNKMKAKMGDRPGAPAAMKHFDAYMSNNEKTTEACVQKVTKGLDDAFPVK